jgi:hypothetical protein
MIKDCPKRIPFLMQPKNPENSTITEREVMKDVPMVGIEEEKEETATEVIAEEVIRLKATEIEKKEEDLATEVETTEKAATKIKETEVTLAAAEATKREVEVVAETDIPAKAEADDCLEDINHFNF